MSEEAKLDGREAPAPKEGQIDIEGMPEAEQTALFKKWRKEAKECTPETVGEFIRKLVTDYCHGYGSIAEALAVAALAGAWAVERSEQGGLTGFQWGWASLHALTLMQYENSILGIRVQKLDDILFPQYADKFAVITVRKDKAVKIRETAKKMLEEEHGAHEAVRIQLGQCRAHAVEPEASCVVR